MRLPKVGDETERILGENVEDPEDVYAQAENWRKLALKRKSPLLQGVNGTYGTNGTNGSTSINGIDSRRPRGSEKTYHSDRLSTNDEEFGNYRSQDRYKSNLSLSFDDNRHRARRTASDNFTDDDDLPPLKRSRHTMPPHIPASNNSLRGFDDSPFDESSRSQPRLPARTEINRESASISFIRSLERAKEQLQSSPELISSHSENAIGSFSDRYRNDRKNGASINDRSPSEENILSPVDGKANDYLPAEANSRAGKEELIDSLQRQIYLLEQELHDAHKLLRIAHDERDIIREELRQSYSRKASERIHQIRQRYELQLEEARRLVLQERREKAELVRACDTYFKSVADREEPS